MSEMRKKTRNKFYTTHDSVKEVKVLCMYDLIKIRRSSALTVNHMQKANPYVVIIGFSQGSTIVKVMYPNGYITTYPRKYVDVSKRISINKRAYLNHINELMYNKLSVDEKFIALTQALN